ncbi:alpha/beta hydrolase family protein [uncultured Corynebacterium sp.]|uniref:alpha/beta hydrolase n=1 Tax=uncultured Corynebacterium sp. TaxID=159447 RepID=UPI0025D05A14|nr:alpha/beta hydrolase family protein [uncultured Corynebacterium sp.]
MSGLSSALTAASRRVVAAVVALVVAASLAAIAAPRASAANRDWLRADATGSCDWDAVGYWVQRCDVWSPSMNRTIPVQIQPAIRGGNAGLYLLDGLRATDYTNAWLNDVNAARLYVNDNITLVMPVGGAASFYTDWEGPATYDVANPVRYMWETFLTSELPAYLESNFGVARNNNSIAGLSMGGSAAITLAGKHPDQFRQALSYSGYLAYTFPGAHTFMRMALLDAGGYNLNAMYGSMFSPRRFESDPFNQISGLRNTDVYISAASGVPSPADQGIAPQYQASGVALEAFSNLTTHAWEAKARAMGINVTADYPAQGEHNWINFGGQLVKTRERVLNVMNAW